MLRWMVALVIAVVVLANTRGWADEPQVGSGDPPVHKELKAYPAAEAGMVRYVIVLPDKERGEEDAFQVELIAGRVIETDGVNTYRIGLGLESKIVQGWGYPYYEVTGSDVVASTLIGVPPDAPRVNKFVGGEPLMIRYNSRLPIVVYAREGIEIRYRIWSAPDKHESAPQG